MIATLEDLWAEKDPQNIPGTTVEHENFTRRFVCTRSTRSPPIAGSSSRSSASIAPGGAGRRSGGAGDDCGGAGGGNNGDASADGLAGKGR